MAQAETYAIYAMPLFSNALQCLRRDFELHGPHIHRRHFSLVEAYHHISLVVQIERGLIGNRLEIPLFNFILQPIVYILVRRHLLPHLFLDVFADGRDIIRAFGKDILQLQALSRIQINGIIVIPLIAAARSLITDQL